MARPAHKPEPEKRFMVAAYTAGGATQETVAKLLEISVPTLTKHYPNELATGLEMANAQIAGALFKEALSGDVQAQKFWLKTRAKWREKHEVEVKGKLTISQLVSSFSEDEINADISDT